MKENFEKIKITKVWARKALKAVKELIERYKTGERTLLACPLCVMGGDYANKKKDNSLDSSCKYCPWVVFKGASCMSLGYNKVPTSVRLRRLGGWKRKLQNIINKQEESERDD